MSKVLKIIGWTLVIFTWLGACIAIGGFLAQLTFDLYKYLFDNVLVALGITGVIFLTGLSIWLAIKHVNKEEIK